MLYQPFFSTQTPLFWSFIYICTRLEYSTVKNITKTKLSSTARYTETNANNKDIIYFKSNDNGNELLKDLI